MLGAHPEIYAGGELSALILSRGEEGVGSCSGCGFACPYWNEQARTAATKANLYRVVDRIFGKRIVVDSSKSIDWFNDVLASEEHRGISTSYVLMVKHPIRYLASCVANIAPHKPKRAQRGFLAGRSAARGRQDFLEELIEELDAYYEQFFWNFGQTVGGTTFHLVHDERLVEDCRTALAPLLRALGLSFLPQMGDFFGLQYHQIGGNAGPLFQLGQGWPKGADPAEARRKFYEQSAALRIDDKYRQLLPESELKWLLAHPVVCSLCERLGYEDPAMPFPIR
jgi:hypothetical protein